MMTDPIADMLTRIRNANAIERPAVEMQATKLKVAVAKVLVEEGFILGFRTGLYGKNGQLSPRHADWAERLSSIGLVVLLPDSFGSRGVASQCKTEDRIARPSRERVPSGNTTAEPSQ